MIAMKIRLSGGVVATGQRAWTAGRAGPVEVVSTPAPELGAPVALGPSDADADAVSRAVRELTRLVVDGGTSAAGAGVDLGSGFRSARLAGARGDHRDAVLAALRLLGLAQADRLGDRAGVLVALFGPTATKRVGTAAASAIDSGRWDAVTLASAASDLLGPEQLEQVLALRAMPGADFVPGPASALAAHLRQVLEPLPAPRRLELLLDLWGQVSAHHAEHARRARLLATQGRRDRTEDLRKRREHLRHELVLNELRAHVHKPADHVAEVALWVPSAHHWRRQLDGFFHDVLAATALLRTAVAVAEHGLNEGLARSAALLRAAGELLSPAEAGLAARRVPGLTGLPARPGCSVRDIDRRLSVAGPRDHGFEDFVRQRLASARDFGVVLVAEAASQLQAPHPWATSAAPHPQTLRAWAATSMQHTRKSFGYTQSRPPSQWVGLYGWGADVQDGGETLARRLAAAPPAEASTVEVVGDLLWFAEMIDALAALHGHEMARGPQVLEYPWLEYDPKHEPTPLAPQLDSVTGAIASAAQLIELGGVPPRKPKAWQEFTDELLASTSVAASLTGQFRIPAQLTAVDGALVAGTGLRVAVARSHRTLAEWSDYMGNCIAGPHYAGQAAKGKSILTGLYDERGTLLINAELVALRPAARGWRVDEIQARFNQAPDETIEQQFRAWVAAVPGPAAAPRDESFPEAGAEVCPEVAEPLAEPPPGAARRGRAAPLLLKEVGPVLGPLAQQAWQEVDAPALDTFAALAGGTQASVTARLRHLMRASRLNSCLLADACRRVLDDGTVTLPDLWAATSARPLHAAVAALDPALRTRFGGLALLLGDQPMPKSLRKLVNLPAIADAYTLDLAARGARRAIGDLTLQDDPVIARAVSRAPSEQLLCALTVMFTCRAPAVRSATVAVPRVVSAPRMVSVPGYPVTALNDEDGPWQRAFPAARELGADTSVFWDEISARGLRIPASWLAHGSWPALWSRAHR